MAIIPDVIREIKNDVFYMSRKTDQIQTAIDRLAALPAERMTTENHSAAVALKALLEVKLATIMVFKGQYTHQKAVDACLVIDRAKAEYKQAKLEANPDYLSEADKFAALKESVMEVAEYIDDIDKAFAELAPGGTFGGNIEDYYRLKAKLGKVQQREWAPYFPEVGGKQFVYISVQTELKRILDKKTEALALSMSIGLNVGDAAFRNTLDNYDDCDYLPSIALAARPTDAPICMISTPFEAEFDVLLNANKEYHGLKRTVVQMDFGWLAKSNAGSDSARSLTGRAFALAGESKHPDVIGVYGLDKLADKTRDGFYLGVSDYVRLTGGAVYVAILDLSGDMRALGTYQSLKRTQAMEDADNKYLRLPSFEDVKTALRGQEDDTLEQIRKTCPFMGYVGFNRLVKNIKSNPALALDEAKSASDLNLMQAHAFLNRLTDASKVVPFDWKWTPTEAPKPVLPGGSVYDYDQIRDVDDVQVLRILANTSLDMYQRCGELVRYCLLADEDRSVWKNNLDDRQREERLKKAVRVVAYAMKVYYDNPTVEVVSAAEGSWGGQCCGGGATIKFKHNSLQDIDWTMDAVVHELYHSLQHTVVDKNMPLGMQWYKQTYHISNERIETWRDNVGKNYIDIDENEIGYWLQTLEADARDFAGLCLGDQVYHSHNSYR